MKRVALALLLSGSVVVGCAAPDQIGTEEANLEPQGGDNGAPPPDARGVQWARGQAGGKGTGSSSPVLIYHQGPVQTAGTYVEAIYWGASWGDASFIGDKQTGLASFYKGLGGSKYAGTNGEYTDTTGGHVSTAVSYNGLHTDLTNAPKFGNKTTPILDEACAHASKLVSNGYYPVYTDSPRGHSGYCAWHSTGTCPDGTQIQIGFFYNLDGDPGCDPQSTVAGQSQGLQALANVSGHEWSEMVTDMHIDAWYAGNGQENADECAWTFGSTPVALGKTQWKIQGNFSNAAYASKSGYDGAGCIDGN
jgi:hypothetical protein